MTPGCEVRARIREREPDATRSVSADPARTTIRKAEKRWVCRNCATYVTRASELLSMGERSPTAVFANPHGLVFEIITVRVAENLQPIGFETSEFTWFPGYAWTVVVCAKCVTHLGWRFDAVVKETSPPQFYGLLCTELVERNE